MTVYLDCNATTPIEPAVLDIVMHHMRDEYGNAGSRTHEYGLRAKRAVEKAREQVARVVAADKVEVVFTSGATESNNLAILGLAEAADKAGRKHIISSRLEHKAVLEPLEQLARRGFEVELLPSDARGWIEPAALAAALRPETFLVSLMHVNNETGVVQPVEDYAQELRHHDAYLHVDAAQGYGKDLGPLREKRIDLISVSGHKLYGPMGIGALIARHRNGQRPPLTPLVFGGGQEHSLRPGTIPVPLVAGFGKAAQLALDDHGARSTRNQTRLQQALDALLPLGAQVNGDCDRLLGNSLSLSWRGVDSEALILVLKGVVAISNGSACTSNSYKPSHVLAAMLLPAEQVEGAVRFSWCHLSPEVDWSTIAGCLRRLTPLAPAAQ